MQHAVRTLLRDRWFTLTAILVLALGIGAVSAIFSVVYSVLLQPLAYADPSRLYAIQETILKVAQQYPMLPVNARHYQEWSKHLTLGLLAPDEVSLTGEGDPERIGGVKVSASLLPMLGVVPERGRLFNESDDRPGAPKVAMLSDSLWRNRFHSDPNIIGRTIRLDGEINQVIGLLPPGFQFPRGDQLTALINFPDHSDILRPIAIDYSKMFAGGNFNYAAILRLRAGDTPEKVTAQMDADIADLVRRMNMETKTRLIPLHEMVTGKSERALWLLLGAVGAVLLIVCLNLSNLMLVRATARLRESAIRKALGARMLQVLAPIVAEGLVLAAAGGALGVALAYAGVKFLVRLAPLNLPRIEEVHVSGMTLLASFALAAFAGIFCGLLPALRHMFSDPQEALRGSGRSLTEARSKLRSREVLVGIEVALSTVLLITAALLGASFNRLLKVERGYRSAHVITARDFASAEALSQ